MTIDIGSDAFFQPDSLSCLKPVGGGWIGSTVKQPVRMRCCPATRRLEGHSVVVTDWG